MKAEEMALMFRLALTHLGVAYPPEMMATKTIEESRVFKHFCNNRNGRISMELLDWLHTHSTVKLTSGQFSTSPRVIVNLMKKEWQTAAKELVQEVDRLFFSYAGLVAKPEEWRLVGMKGWWLRPTVKVLGEDIVIDFESSFTFERMPVVEELPVDAVAG